MSVSKVMSAYSLHPFGSLRVLLLRQQQLFLQASTILFIFLYYTTLFANFNCIFCTKKAAFRPFSLFIKIKFTVFQNYLYSQEQLCQIRCFHLHRSSSDRRSDCFFVKTKIRNFLHFTHLLPSTIYHKIPSGTTTSVYFPSF